MALCRTVSSIFKNCVCDCTTLNCSYQNDYFFQNESTYVLKEPINTSSAINFITNYHNKSLSRHLKSRPKKHIKSSPDTKRYIPIKQTYTLREINSDNFIEHVVLSNKVCTFCHRLFHSVNI